MKPGEKCKGIIWKPVKKYKDYLEDGPVVKSCGHTKQVRAMFLTCEECDIRTSEKNFEDSEIIINGVKYYRAP